MTFIERIRAFEHQLLDRMDEFKCPVHLSLGQEAVAAELHERLNPHDWLFSTHRNHAHYLAKGGSEQKLLDEILGLPSGINGGFSGSMAMTDPSLNFHASAIVGGAIGMATGAALALKLVKSQAIVVCVFGDAAAEQGILWESLNFAALKRLPVVYICENNGYSTHTPINERQYGEMRSKARAFGVYSAWNVSEAVSRTRVSGFPSFCEVKVKRECAHANNMIDFREQDADLRAVNQ